MHGMKEIIEEAESLPVEERVVVIDSLLKTINRPTAEIDTEWIKTARRRLTEMRSGQVTPIPGSDVFDKIRNRFQK